MTSLTAVGGPVPVLQRGYDAGVVGANVQETTLTVKNVTPTGFGLRFSLPVDDAVYAQPLYVPALTIGGVTRNVLYVATMSDTVYAFDADTGTSLWSANLATRVAAAPVPMANFAFAGNRNIVGNLGILSTPVIDAGARTMYLVAATVNNGAMEYRLHAIDITNGAEVGNAPQGVLISGAYGGSVFNARYQTQRLSLVLSGNHVVFGFGAIELEYTGGYVGWVMAYNKSTLQQDGIFATVTTGNRGGGVWQSGRPPAVDAAGYVYIFTGNAYGNGYDGVNNFAESALKLDPAKGLALVDWFTPGDWSSLDNMDVDLGSSGPMLVPGTTPSLLTGGGKAGDFYVLNTANLGRFNLNDTQIPQKLHISNSEVRGGPVFWQRSSANGGPLLYNWGVNDQLKAFSFSGNRIASSPSKTGSIPNQIYPGGILALSANGESPGTGIVWASAAGSGDAENNPPVPGVLHAFDAANLGVPLWSSTMNPSRDGFGNFAKFVPPLVVNGKVYLATSSNQVAVYGLLALADYSIAIGSSSQTVPREGSATYQISVAPVGGFVGPVTFSVSGLPDKVTASFVPDVNGLGTALIVVTDKNTQKKTTAFTVTGTSAGMVRNASATLTVVK